MTQYSYSNDGERYTGSFATREDVIQNDPTERQLEMLSVIFEFIQANKYPPSIRDIAARMNIASNNGVVCHLKALEKKNLISRHAGHNKGGSRTIVLLKSPRCPYCNCNGSQMPS